MRTASTPDRAVIHYLDQGSGAPIMLLPGLGCTHQVWQPQIDQLGSGYRVLAVEPRGVGESSRLRGVGNILQRQSEDLLAVLDHAELDEVVVAGVSYGGVLAQRFALDNPTRVRGVAVIDSFSSTEDTSAWLLHATSWLWLFPALVRPAIRSQYRRWPEVGAYMDRTLRELRQWETVKIRYALNRINYEAELARLSVPLLAVSADHPTLRRMGQRMAEAAPDSRLINIENSFDPSTLCQPEQISDLLADFMEHVIPSTTYKNSTKKAGVRSD